MIKNDRQYRLSKAQLRAFEGAITDLQHRAVPAGVDPGLPELERRALESQREELSSEVQEYEALKAGKVTNFEAHSLEELPTLLVKARIARGITHKQLAKRLGIKEQQVQRWESNDFSGASIENLKSIGDALRVVLTQRLFVPRTEVTPNKFLGFLGDAGLSPEFVLRRIVPAQIADSFRRGNGSLRDIVQSAATISKVFGLNTKDLVDLKAPRFDYSVVAATRFKLPAIASRQAVSGYTLYAHYLAALLTQCVKGGATRDFPSTAQEFFDAVTQPGEPMSFERVVRFLWDCGILVLPLSDAGGFHGAVWKISGRFVMVLKQSTPLESRWLYDALHESGHVKNGDVKDDSAFIENEEISPDASGAQEEAANEWAEDALFDGKSDELEEASTRACGGRLQKLKDALPRVAKEFNVNLGALANYMAYRLAQQRENWWGAAHNLQWTGRKPFEIAREVLFERIDLFCLSGSDRDLLQRALSDE